MSKGVRRILHMCYFVLDLSLHILFVFHRQGTRTNVLGLAIPQTVRGRLLYLVTWTSVLIAACILSARLGFRRQFKYASYGFHYMQHTSMVRLPAYAASPLLITAAWATTYGIICYLSHLISHSQRWCFPFLQQEFQSCVSSSTSSICTCSYMKSL